MPGERTPRKVPMMPETDIGAIRFSLSNHSERKSTALIVIILALPTSHLSPWPRIPFARRASFRSSRGLRDTGSGATSSITGLTRRPSSAISWPKRL